MLNTCTWLYPQSAARLPVHIPFAAASSVIPTAVSLLTSFKLSLSGPVQKPWTAVTLEPKCPIIWSNIHFPGQPVPSLGKFSTMNDTCPPLTSSPMMKLLCFDEFTSSKSVADAFLTSGQQFDDPEGAGTGPTDALCTNTSSPIRYTWSPSTSAAPGCSPFASFCYIIQVEATRDDSRLGCEKLASALARAGESRLRSTYPTALKSSDSCKVSYPQFVSCERRLACHQGTHSHVPSVFLLVRSDHCNGRAGPPYSFGA